MDQGATLRHFAKTVVNFSSGLLLARLTIPRSRNVGCFELLLSLEDPAGGRTSAAHRSSTPRVTSTPLRGAFAFGSDTSFRLRDLERDLVEVLVQQVVNNQLFEVVDSDLLDLLAVQKRSVDQGSLGSHLVAKVNEFLHHVISSNNQGLPDWLKAGITSLRDPQRESGQPIELVDEFCYLGCTLKNDGSYERDIQQRCTKANSTVNSLTKCLWSTLIANEVKPGCLPIRNFPYHDVGIGDLGSAVDGDGEAGLHGERELFRRLLSTFRPMVWCNEELYSEVHMMCRQMTRGKHQHLARLSEVFTGNRLRFSGHVMRRPCDRLGHVVLRMIQTQTGKALLVVKECFRGDDEGRSEDTWR
ncbi:hypothetical protein RB195_024946 [Necator americanus]|uniref:Uncharacterized protein n=1 Tax=Necator americanus TaxID=51031 RepID=A0ABR1EQ88_NECAM